MSTESFGDHPLLERWGTARAFANGEVTFASAVVPHLIEGMNEFLVAPASRDQRNFRYRIATGAVAWLTSSAIAHALTRFDGTCITVDKDPRNRAAINYLSGLGTPIQATALGLETLSPLSDGGEIPILGPSSACPGAHLALGPVRSAGYTGGTHTPLMHAKMLVLSYVDHLDYGEDWDGYHLRPIKAWIGSANWTASAASHLEFGLWTTDPELVQVSFEFLTDVIRLSEPIDSTSPSPDPEFHEVAWDDEAFREADRDLREPED